MMLSEASGTGFGYDMGHVWEVLGTMVNRFLDSCSFFEENAYTEITHDNILFTFAHSVR